MAIVTQGAVILANGFDLSPYFKKVEPQGETDSLDSTALNASGNRSFQPGLSMMKINGEGFFSYDGTTDANSIDKFLNDALSSSASCLFTIGAQDSSVGSPALMMNTIQKNYSVQETVGELLMTQFEASATLNAAGTIKPYANGLWLRDATHTGTANGTSVDNAASSTGYITHCHVTGAVALTSVTVKVQHSTDNSIWADLVTFTAFTANGAEQKFNTATSVNRYRRAIVSAFSGTSARVSVSFKSAYAG
jgi:hypothetical protein